MAVVNDNNIYCSRVGFCDSRVLHNTTVNPLLLPSPLWVVENFLKGDGSYAQQRKTIADAHRGRSRQINNDESRSCSIEEQQDIILIEQRFSRSESHIVCVLVLDYYGRRSFSFP
jgi:hypothetical protein